ncbi:hypothetical protein PROFUN_16946, partial [Planoprotostelium fungivorum]
ESTSGRQLRLSPLRQFRHHQITGEIDWVMPRLFKRKGRKSSTPLAKVARTPQSSERNNSKHVKEDSPSVPSSPTSESADKEVASPTSTQPEAEENDHPPGMNRQLFNMINGLQAMVDENRASTESNIDRLKTSLVNVMPRSFKRKGKKSSTPPTKVARTPQSSERSNSKHVEGESPSVPSSPTSELADKEVASPTEGGEDNEREDNSNQPEVEENDHPPGMDRQLFNMINGLQAMVDKNRASTESNIDRLKTSLVNKGYHLDLSLSPPQLELDVNNKLWNQQKQPDRPPTVVVREVSQVTEEVTTTTEKEIALPASDLLIADQMGLGLPQWLRDMRMHYGNLTGVWKKLQKMGSPILIGNNNINNNTLRTWMHDIDYRWHAFREDNKSLMLLFIRGIESKNHALQNYTMSFTSTLPINSSEFRGRGPI